MTPPAPPSEPRKGTESAVNDGCGPLRKKCRMSDSSFISSRVMLLPPPPPPPKRCTAFVSPMAQWAKLFAAKDDEEVDNDESDFDDDDDADVHNTGNDDSEQSNSSIDDDDDDDYDESDYDEEEENRCVKALVEAVFAPSARTHAIARLIGTAVPTTTMIAITCSIKPGDHLRAMLQAAGKPHHSVAASSFGNDGRFFERVTDAYVQGYTLEVVQAVRADSADALRQLAEKGRLSVPCGTAQGDSIVHAACRRQCVTALRFLLQLCEHRNSSGSSSGGGGGGKPVVTVRCKNACGRTPLSDCCWTTQPSWKAAWLVLSQCPDLLYITDKYGSAPLDYVPKQHWVDWCRFLDAVGADRLAAREIHQEVQING